MINSMDINNFVRINSNEGLITRTWFLTESFTHKEVRLGEAVIVITKHPVFIQDAIIKIHGKIPDPARPIARFTLKKDRELFHPEMFDY